MFIVAKFRSWVLRMKKVLTSYPTKMPESNPKITSHFDALTIEKYIVVD